MRITIKRKPWQRFHRKRKYLRFWQNCLVNKIIWFISVAFRFSKIGVATGGQKKLPFWNFQPQLFISKHSKNLFSDFQTILSQGLLFLGFTLKEKDALRTRLVVREVQQCPEGRCNEVLLLMFETTFFGHWVKHHL